MIDIDLKDIMAQAKDTGPDRYAVRLGKIESVNIETRKVRISLDLSGSTTNPEVDLPVSWRTNSGGISIGWPSRGTPVHVVQTNDKSYTIVGFADFKTSGDSDYDTDGSPLTTPLWEKHITEGRHVTLVDNDVHVITDPNDGVYIGDSTNFLRADPGLNIISTNFSNRLSFSEAHREITGSIKRDRISDYEKSLPVSTLTSHEYDDLYLEDVGLDPSSLSGQDVDTAGNPTFVESRNIYYEFSDSYGYINDKDESRRQDGEDVIISSQLKRWQSRADTLSLSLYTPNQLIESTVGTVVDFCGNVLDINRHVLPSGQIDSLSFSSTEKTRLDVFKKLREQARKSIAFHWELNARKADKGKATRKDLLKDGLQDLNSTDDYARARSRLFLDIDKEGQFKLNIPASSEVGNVPLLTRYENFSAVYGDRVSLDRDLFVQSEDNVDIMHDQFGTGGIKLTSGDKDLDAVSVPKDRFTGNPITLGTAFHDLNSLFSAYRVTKPFTPSGNNNDPESVFNSFATIGDIYSKEIIISGDNANAGGRSGSITLDGFVSMSIGANTIDRQSLWLDTAGGIVAGIGADNNGRSLAASFDGDVIVQIGGVGVTNDSRFSNYASSPAPKNGVLEFRISCAGSFHIIRVEAGGVYVRSANQLVLEAETNVFIRAAHGSVNIDGPEGIFLYTNSMGPGQARLVKQVPMETIG